MRYLINLRADADKYASLPKLNCCVKPVPTLWVAR
jgi:hypothetical protein